MLDLSLELTGASGGACSSVDAAMKHFTKVENLIEQVRLMLPSYHPCVDAWSCALPPPPPLLRLLLHHLYLHHLQENRYRCEKCKQLAYARKQLTLHTPPRHLTVQVTLTLPMLT